MMRQEVRTFARKNTETMEKLSMQALARLSVEDFKQTAKMPVVLVLDHVRSALNVGSVFRTADAFALSGIVLCGITAQPPHREILKTALGSTESVSWQYIPETADAVKLLRERGFRVIAVEQTQPKTWLHQLTIAPEQPVAFIFGNEVNGVDETVLTLCDEVVEIPQFGTKHSLNVAVSAGIVCWELGRKWAGEKLTF
jgi:23S rRNA (guanosine2251-2'-O)-methyltransferase